MTAALLLGALWTSRQQGDDEAERLAAVRKVVEFARRVEAVCAPRYRTTPPTPYRAVPDLPLIANWAKTRGPGAYSVRFGDVGGVVNSGRVSLTFRYGQTLPEGARPWTSEELIENARKVAEILKPADYGLGESRMVGDAGRIVVTSTVVPQDPRLHAGPEIQIDMNRITGMPTTVWAYEGKPPAIAPERLTGILPEEELMAEALRVHRTLPPFGPARLSGNQYTYSVPNCSKMVNEMTPEHHGYSARGAAIPLYKWQIVEFFRGGFRQRRVWVDARTGHAIGVNTVERKTHQLGRPADLEPVSRPDTGHWHIGKVEGTFTKVDDVQFDGIQTVVTNDKQEVRTLSFDVATGLVRDDSGTYRPDAALLEALRAEEPPRPFGKR